MEHTIGPGLHNFETFIHLNVLFPGPHPPLPDDGSLRRLLQPPATLAATLVPTIVLDLLARPGEALLDVEHAASLERKGKRLLRVLDLHE